MPVSRLLRAILLFGLMSVLAGGLSLVMAQGKSPNATPPPPGPPDAQSAWNTELGGFNDLQGRSCYQPLVVRQDGRQIAYYGHHAGNALNPRTRQMESKGTQRLACTDLRY